MKMHNFPIGKLSLSLSLSPSIWCVHIMSVVMESAFLKVLSEINGSQQVKVKSSEIRNLPFVASPSK